MTEAREIRVGQPHRPFAVKMINFAGRAANAVGMQPVKLESDTIIKKAIKKAGSSDFGGDDFREGLARFLDSAEREGDLTLLGRLMVQGYATDNLVNRLRVVDWRKQHPGRPSFTICATPSLLHWSQPCFMSEAAIARLSTFPEDYDYRDVRPWYVCGMSVPPFMMQRVALEVLKQWLLP